MPTVTEKLLKKKKTRKRLTDIWLSLGKLAQNPPGGPTVC